MRPITVLIADDHPVVAAGLAGLLGACDQFEVVALAKDGREAVTLAECHRPDVVLMDLRMPRMSGFEAIVAMRRDALSSRVLVLTTYETDADISAALEAGASGYLLKDATPDRLYAAIRAVAAGERVLAPAVEERLTHARRAPHGALSAREVEVLDRVARGESNRAIAKKLYISEATVKTHLLHLFAKLGVNDRTAAVIEAARLGILNLDRTD